MPRVAAVCFDAGGTLVHLDPPPDVVFAGLSEVLGTLRRAGLPLAVVSNWDPGLAHLLERLGLRDAFAVVVASAEVGVAKPDPRISTLALDVLGMPPAEVLHVGDLYDLDVVGGLCITDLPALLPIVVGTGPRAGR